MKKPSPQQVNGWQFDRYYIAAVFLVIIASQAINFIPQHSSWWFKVGGYLVIIGALIAAFRHKQRLRARVRGSAGRMCMHCKYSLVDLPAPGVCPECGHAFPEDSYASNWRKTGFSTRPKS